MYHGAHSAPYEAVNLTMFIAGLIASGFSLQLNPNQYLEMDRITICGGQFYLLANGNIYTPQMSAQTIRGMKQHPQLDKNDPV